MHIAESSCIYFPLFCCRQEAADIHFRRCRRTFFIMHRVKHRHTPDFHEVLMMQETLFIAKITLRADMLSKIQNVAFEPLIKTMKTVTTESLQVCCSVVDGKQCIFCTANIFTCPSSGICFSILTWFLKKWKRQPTADLSQILISINISQRR